jgi:hypothetical protein
MKRSRLSWAAGITMAAAAILATSVPAHASTTPNVYLNVRDPDGSWQGYEPLTQPPGGCCLAITAAEVEANETHVDVVTGTGLWDGTVDPGGNWSGWTQPPQPPGTFSAFGQNPFAAVSDDGGGMWVFARTSSGLYAAYLNSGGEWDAWKPVALPSGVSASGVSDIAVAYTQDGAENGTSPELQVMVDNNGTLWHQVYSFTTETWSGWAQPRQVPGEAEAIAAAGDTSGNVQFIATNYSGTVYHNIRYASGGWQGWAEPPQPVYPPPAGTVPLGGGISAAVDGGGLAEFTLAPAQYPQSPSSFLHTVRNANGSWQSSWGAPPGTLPAGCVGNRLAVAADTVASGFPFYFATYC